MCPGLQPIVYKSNIRGLMTLTALLANDLQIATIYFCCP